MKFLQFKSLNVHDKGCRDRLWVVPVWFAILVSACGYLNVCTVGRTLKRLCFSGSLMRH